MLESSFPGKHRVRSEDFTFLESPHPYGVLPSGNKIYDDVQTPETARNSLVLGSLSDEDWNHALSFCDASDLARIAQTCRYFYVIAHQPELWRDLVLRGKANGLIEKMEGSWKDTFVKTFHPDEFKLPHRPIQVPGIYSDFLYRLHSCRAFSLPESWYDSEYGNVDVVPAGEMTTQRFLENYEERNVPVLIRGAAHDWDCSEKWKDTSYCLQKTKGRSFRATSGVAPLPANFTLESYLEYCKFDNLEEAPLYLFDRTALAPGSPLWHDYMEGLKSACPYWDPTSDEVYHDLFKVLGEGKRPDHTWIIVGPKRSGSVFHIDPNATHAWNAAIVGRKRWIFYPPGIAPPGVHPSEDGDEVALPLSVGEFLLSQWKEHNSRYMEKDESRRPLECTAFPGDIMFVPHGWWHMVINLDEINVAITHNYVGKYNLPSVLRFLREKEEQISGCRDREESIKPHELYHALHAQLEHLYPEILQNALLQSKRWVCPAWKDVASASGGRKRKNEQISHKSKLTKAIQNSQLETSGFSFSFM